MVLRHLLILLLSLFFFNPYALADEKKIGHGRSLGLKPDFLSQIQRLKTSGPMTKTRKIGPGLNRHISRKAITGKSSAVLSQSDNANDKIKIILETSKDLDPDTIKRYGGRLFKQRANLAVVEIPAGMTEAMVNDIEDIKHARLPLKFFPTVVTSEGVSLTGAIDYHDAGYTGQGVKVAVIDSGFKGLSDARNNGELPSVLTHDYTGNGLESKYYHGTACAEIVHDMAPGAELHLLKVSDELDIYNALDYCINNDIDIISLSLSTFGSGLGDGTGYLDEAFNQARTNGILVVASAGNYSYGRHWEGLFSDYYNDDIHIHEFIAGDPDSIYNAIAAWPEWDDDGNPEPDEVTIVMRWNDNWANASVDYDIFLFNYETAELVALSNAYQDGSQPPLEIIIHDLPNTTSDDIHYYALVVTKDSNETENIELEIYLGGTSMFVPFYKYPSAISTPSSSIGEPADAESVLAVGAINYTNWSAGPQESFSSQGPTNAWEGSSARKKPDICGPDGVTSLSYGISSFFGTSASAPHVAGAAALILSRYPYLGPDELQSYIEDNAIDMGELGKDNIYGSGRMDMTFTIDNPDPVSGGGSSSAGGGGGGGGDGGGCFIATAAFGSSMEPQVKILREFRDSILLTNPVGKAFVALYNRYSPAAASFIARHDMLRSLVRLGLIPIVYISWLVLRLGLSESMALFLLLTALACISMAAVLNKRINYYLRASIKVSRLFKSSTL